ncbi:MAG: ammonium transporter [Dehalococcoidia bacterium]|nr:ammonium transporter [Dehalococcoidia bacterium]
MPEISGGDTAWVLVSAALVLLMTPALGFFYGGMVRHKNVVSLILQTFIIVGVISVSWVLWGYSLAFGPDKWGIIGGLDWVGLRGVGMEAGPYSDTIPHQAFMIFQAMFAIITPALIVGAFAERIKFKTLLIFTVLWSTFVYSPIAHWVWGVGGWLGNYGALDFAGGTVVHISSGVAARAAIWGMRKRLGFGRDAMEPHNVPFIVLGAALLWFGWFGFNAGSSLAADGLAANAFVVTNTAAAMGALTWMTMTWCLGGRPSAVGAASGAVAGLVAITPAAGFVGPVSAILIGLGAGAFCYLACRLRAKLKLDDSLDVWGVHGVGGTWGAIATGLFATAAIGGTDGLFYGNTSQLWTQLAAVGVTWAFSFTMTIIILKVLDWTVGLTVNEEEENRGLDLSQHGEAGYRL